MTRDEIIQMFHDGTPAAEIYWKATSKNWFIGLNKYIPDYMHEGVIRYVLLGVKPGRFLSAVLYNSLHDAVRYADDTNVGLLRDYVIFLHNCAPGDCYGSMKIFNEWQGMFPAQKEEEV